MSVGDGAQETNDRFGRRIVRTSPDWLDADGAKIYTISIADSTVDRVCFVERLGEVKRMRGIEWSRTPHFAIFHCGSTCLYLVLAWWGNDNELFTSVSVKTAAGWIEQPDRYSFCIYDLEVMWEERQVYIDTMYREHRDICAYRVRRRQDWLSD
ncbi:MAG: hypothetical protein ACTHJP_09095 [Rhodanobacteraceae bacterium]